MPRDDPALTAYIAKINAQCNDCIVLWPDVEAIDLYCIEPAGHVATPEHPHTDGDWRWVEGVEDAVCV